jgi:hypothetical protein
MPEKNVEQRRKLAQTNAYQVISIPWAGPAPDITPAQEPAATAHSRRLAAQPHAKITAPMDANLMAQTAKVGEDGAPATGAGQTIQEFVGMRAMGFLILAGTAEAPENVLHKQSA